MFKDKTSKKRLNNTENYRDKCTLDTMHHDIIKDFENKSIKYNECLITLENLNLNKNIIMSNIEILSENKDNLNTIEYDNLWNSNIKIKEEIYNINKELKKIENYNEIDYYKDTSDILFNYYNIIESQSKNNNPAKKTVLDALNNKNVVSINNTDKSGLVDEYLSLTNNQVVRLGYS